MGEWEREKRWLSGERGCTCIALQCIYFCAAAEERRRAKSSVFSFELSVSSKFSKLDFLVNLAFFQHSFTSEWASQRKKKTWLTHTHTFSLSLSLSVWLPLKILFNSANKQSRKGKWGKGEHEKIRDRDILLCTKNETTITTMKIFRSNFLKKLHPSFFSEQHRMPLLLKVYLISHFYFVVCTFSF